MLILHQVGQHVPQVERVSFESLPVHPPYEELYPPLNHLRRAVAGGVGDVPNVAVGEANAIEQFLGYLDTA